MLNFLRLPKHLKGRINVLVMKSLLPLRPPQRQGLIAHKESISGAEADKMPIALSTQHS
jgi:hypothetical protein